MIGTLTLLCMCVSHILMCDIKDLLTWVVVTLLLCILGSTRSHKISGGKLQLVERAMGGTYYGWAQMYLQAVRHQLNNAKASGTGFFFGSFLCAFFFEKVPTLHLHWAMQDSGPQETQMY